MVDKDWRKRISVIEEQMEIASEDDCVDGFTTQEYAALRNINRRSAADRLREMELRGKLESKRVLRKVGAHRRIVRIYYFKRPK